MVRSAAQAASDLGTAEVDIVAFCCTSGTFMCDRVALNHEMAKNAGCPATTASDAVIAALRALGVRRVALATPYLDFVNEQERAFLQREGIEVVSMLGLGLGRTQAERRAMNRIPHEAVYNMARSADHPEADAVFLSCAALAGIHLIPQMEAEFGKPVITSNQATFWQVLRMLKLKLSITGYGSLFQHP
jgi:arylmalonate decarboxylase